MFVLSKRSPSRWNPIQVERTGHVYYSVGTEKRGNKKYIEYDKTRTTRDADNVWDIAAHSKNAANDDIAFHHPAIFPEALARDHILSWSNEGDLVLDPFAGSFTTCRAAYDNGRRSIGIEVNPEYCEIGRKRLAQKVLDF